jgi:predicted glycoside hydrolase/deacetylase ChbG (UPF0249 family)
METDRRQFIQGMAVGAAGLALTGSAEAHTRRRGRRKMIVRGDDVGQSVVCNIGSFEAIENGVVTSADVMLDSPGTEDALLRLRRLRWISVGWHTHMWGTPVLTASQVPSLVEHGGPFDGRFRTDLSTAADVVAEEALAELRAQLARCRRILGKLPDTSGGGNTTTIWGRALRQVVDEHGIARNFSAQEPTPAWYIQHIVDARARGEEWAQFYSTTPNPRTEPDPQWASRKIIAPAGTTAYIDLLTDSISAVEKNYDPVLYYTEDRFGILNYPKDVITWQAWHPGYIDYYVYRLGERVARPRAQQFVIGRVQDVAAMTDPRLKNWIRENQIELINFRDALYGTNEYQDHLRRRGRD